MVIKSHTLLLLGALTLLVFGLVYFAPISYAGADPRFSLLVAQSVLEHGTIKLDAYAAAGAIDAGHRNLITHQGHLYYYFPLGTSLLALPVVWLARQAGFDFIAAGRSLVLQNVLAALTCAAIFILLFLLARRFLNDRWSLLLATVTMLGSGLVSTLGTALWNQNLATIFILLALYWLVAVPAGNETPRWQPCLLGAALFGAFLCRPTTAIFIGAALLYLLNRNRPYFWRTAGTALIPFLGWLGFNLLEFGQPLAPYYAVSRLQRAETSLATAIYGQLFSPSRGLFVFSPFLLLVAGGLLFRGRALRRRRLLLFCLAWLSGHVLVVSLGGNVPWWGGHGFGPRLLVDALPGFYLLLLLFFRHWRQNRPAPPQRALFTVTFALLAGVSIFINSYQGLYNGSSARWNGGPLPPNPHQQTEYLFNWRYPQFAASRDLLCARHWAFMTDRMQAEPNYPIAYTLGTPIRYDVQRWDAIFIGWARPDGVGRPPYCPRSEVVFGATDEMSEPLLLQLVVGGDTGQPAAVSLNGTAVGIIPADARPAGTVTYTFPLDEANLFQDRPNRLGIDMTDPPLPAGNNSTGLHLVQFGLYSATSVTRQNQPALVQWAS